MESLMHGDKLLAESFSKQLKSLVDWGFNTSNLPSAYLTGYLCGLRAKKAGITNAILDIGILVHDNQVKAALSGFVDAGVEIPLNRKWFPEDIENRINGQHIQDYAELLTKENPKKYKKVFSNTLENGSDPTQIVSAWEKAKAALDTKVL